jgi:hypothetical protein
MNETIKEIKQVTEIYSPKLMPEILNMAQASAFATDTITDPFAGGQPPRTSNRILNYRRIQNWENYWQRRQELMKKSSKPSDTNRSMVDFTFSLQLLATCSRCFIRLISLVTAE